MFKVGDKVTWSSQAGGSKIQKTGKVVRVMSATEFKRGWNPCRIAMDEFPGHKRMFDGGNIPGGTEFGYLIEVIKGPRAKPRLYMPYPSKVKAAKEG